MRRLAAVPLLLALALTGLTGCSDEPQTSVTDDGVVETPTDQPNGGQGVDAGSGDPLAPTPASS